MYAEGEDRARRAKHEAKALAGLERAAATYLATDTAGHDPFGCRRLADELQRAVQAERARRDELPPYCLAYEGIWRVQKGGGDARRTFFGAHGADLWLDGKRMALLEALLVRDHDRDPPFRLPSWSGKRVPDWFEDHEAAEERWRKIHAGG